MKELVYLVSEKAEKGAFWIAILLAHLKTDERPSAKDVVMTFFGDGSLAGDLFGRAIIHSLICKGERVGILYNPFDEGEINKIELKPEA